MVQLLHIFEKKEAFTTSKRTLKGTSDKQINNIPLYAPFNEVFDSLYILSACAVSVFSLPPTPLLQSAGICETAVKMKRVKVKQRVWSQRPPFKCEGTVLRRISMPCPSSLSFPSASHFMSLPLQPSLVTPPPPHLHPQRPPSRCSFLPPIPRLSPVILLIPVFLPFCCASFLLFPLSAFRRSHLTSFRSSVDSVGGELLW